MLVLCHVFIAQIILTQLTFLKFTDWLEWRKMKIAEPNKIFHFVFYF